MISREPKEHNNFSLGKAKLELILRENESTQYYTGLPNYSNFPEAGYFAQPLGWLLVMPCQMPNAICHVNVRRHVLKVGQEQGCVIAWQELGNLCARVKCLQERERGGVQDFSTCLAFPCQLTAGQGMCCAMAFSLLVNRTFLI